MKRVPLILMASCVSIALVLAEPLPHARAIIGVPCYDPQPLCVAAFHYPGNHHLELLIDGRKSDYFRRYRLCVRAPGGSLACDVFRIPPPAHHHNFFVSVVTWNRHFPNLGPGRYSARWRRLPSHRLVGTDDFSIR